MSVNPNDFIKDLFTEFKLQDPKSENKTVGELYINPILDQIKNSGTRDASLTQLADELKPLKQKQISQLQSDDLQRIYAAFATSVTSSGYSSFSELEEPLHSEKMSLEKIKENYLRLQQYLFDAFNDPVAFQNFVKTELQCDIVLKGNDFAFTKMPLEPPNQTKECASKTIQREIDGETFVMPELFVTDNLERQFPYFTFQFKLKKQNDVSDETSKKEFKLTNKEKILDQSSAREFIKSTRTFIHQAASNLSHQDQELLFNVILLLQTQYSLNSFTVVAKYFFINALEKLNLLALFSIETTANIIFNPNEKEPGTVKVTLEYSHEFVKKDLEVAITPLEYFHEACRKNGVANEVYLRASVDFIVRVENQNISFEILSHKGSMSFSVNPMELVCNSLKLSSSAVLKLQTEIKRIKPELEKAFIRESNTITSKDIAISLKQSVEEQIKLTDHLIDPALYTIPEVFERDHIKYPALPQIRFSIGGSNALQVTDLDAANTLIENANFFIARLSRDPLIQQTLLNHMLCFCSQRLPIALNFFKDTLMVELAGLGPSFNYTTDLKDANVKIGSVKGIFGSKDDELLVNYEYHFDLSPVFTMRAVAVTAEEKAQLEDCKRALDIDRVLSFSTRGSFILKLDKSLIGGNITPKIEVVNHESRLD